GTSLIFRPEGTPEVVVDYAAGIVTSGSFSRTVEKEVGISDVTHAPEIFIPEDVLAEILSMDIRWDEQIYEYTFHTDQKLRVFEQLSRSMPSLLRMGEYTIGLDMPGNLPPARIARLAPPDIDFAMVRMRSRVLNSGNDARFTDRMSVPQLNLWAQLMGGNLVASVRQATYGSNRSITAERVSWTTWLDQTEISAGDNHFGVSELVFPSIDLVGIRVNGLIGTVTPGDATSGPTGRQTFLPSHIFEGYVPLGSDVTLFINGRELGSQLSRPFDDAPPGMGIYRFEGLNLLTNRLNDIRIVSVAPDGSVEETEREVLGSDLLLSQGKLAYLGGVGAGQLTARERRSPQGIFAGGRMLYGATPDLTIGLSGAFQDQLYRNDVVLFNAFGKEINWLPRQSLHLGSRLVWQPIGRMLVTGEAARSSDPDGICSDWALRLAGDYHHRDIHIRPRVFWYGPSFFEGRNAAFRDRAGGRINFLWHQSPGNRLQLGGAYVRDNLDGRLPGTMAFRIAQIRWVSQTLVPQSDLTLGINQSWTETDRHIRSYMLGLNSALAPDWTLRSMFQFGDDVVRRDAALNDLQFGTFGGMRPLTSRFDLTRRLGRSWRLSFAHRFSGYLERSYIDLSRRQLGRLSWQWRLALGYDWHDDHPVVDNRLEYVLDSTSRSRIVLENRYYSENWSLSLWFQVTGLFGFVDRRPFLVRDTHLNPDAGGVKGRVFLDLNANGLLDSGEPGLRDISVVSSTRRRTSSGRNGEYVIANASPSHHVRVSLEPETLPAIYTPTQATQEAYIQPGMFTQVNLGVAAFGSISGKLAVLSPEKAPQGVRGVRILLLDGEGNITGRSITGRDGSYYLGEVEPGKYSVVIDRKTLPPGYEIEVIAREVEVLSAEEPYDLEDVGFLGQYTGTPPEAVEEIQEEDVRYKVFD
ncbi:MAG: hypothetical protein KAW17_13625, partial [Candidatus Eisenbacteria sp.]|nr:hypothetical protein [Candidatus Eisenbacteria bacterium]